MADRHPDPLATALGAAVRQARTHAALTQAQLAELIDSAPEVVGRIERGHMVPSIPMLCRLCGALKVDANSLLGLRGADSTREVVIDAESPPALRSLLQAARALKEPQLRLLRLFAREIQKARSPGSPPTGGAAS